MNLRVTVLSRVAFDVKKTKYTLPPAQKEHLLQQIAAVVSSRADYAFSYVHGSVIADVPFGDIDLALYMTDGLLPSKELTIKEELNLEIELQEKFGYPFDVRIINTAPLSFCYNVFKNGQLLFENNEDIKVRFVTQTIKRYIDFLPYRKRYLKEVLGLEI